MYISKKGQEVEPVFARLHSECSYTRMSTIISTKKTMLSLSPTKESCRTVSCVVWVQKDLQIDLGFKDLKDFWTNKPILRLSV